MKKYVLIIILLLIGFSIFACQPPKTEPVIPVKIPDGEIDPVVWGKAYPLNYDLWKKTEEPTSPGKSKYKRGSSCPTSYTKYTAGATIKNIPR